ncbi:Uncharacterised protein [Mycobacteroides abscessus subsp. massiliense]|nr:Uncharacterised protein [Mycobacteroides abscessus subsp. massiliense]
MIGHLRRHGSGDSLRQLEAGRHRIRGGVGDNGRALGESTHHNLRIGTPCGNVLHAVTGVDDAVGRGGKRQGCGVLDGVNLD